jgi:ATP-dependent protease Clp ATPase subunit
MMAIIDSNINDLVVQKNTINNNNNIKARNNLINDDNENRKRKKVEYIPQSKGISKFLDEDDF